MKKNRKFSSGAVRDNDIGKESFIECLSFSAMRRYAIYMKTQEKKYPPNNWRKGIPIKEYEQSLFRHLHKYLSNKYEGSNLEPDIDHLGAAFFNLQGIIHEEERAKLTK